MVAVVLGGTGLVGSIVVRRLLADPYFTQVMVVTRRPLSIKNERLNEILIEDIRQLKSLKEKLDGEIYFCCLGTTIKDAGGPDEFRRIDYGAVVEFGDIAVYHGARAFLVLSAMGAKAPSVNLYRHTKGEMELSLQNLGLARLVIFRPGLLMGHRKSKRPLESFFVNFFRATKSVIPETIYRRLATESEILAGRMVKEAKAIKKGVEFINAHDI